MVNNNKMNKVYFFLLITFFSQFIKAQETEIKVIDYKKPKEYRIAEVTVTGVENLDKTILISMSGLKVGDKITIPSEKTNMVIKKFWDQGLFEDVKLSITKTDGLDAYLNIYLQERPRISELIIKGVNKSNQEDLLEKLNLKRGSQITENELNRAVYYIKDHYREKGFFNTGVEIDQKKDTTYHNRVILTFTVHKNKKVKISKIIITGNEAYSDKKIRKKLKKTKQRDLNIFKGSKFLEDEFKEDKDKLYAFYNENGYRDFKILADSVKILNEKRINLYLSLEEGNKFYFRNITWVGNTIYPAEMLNWVLNINKGDVYNKTYLDKRLNSDDDAITSMYMDNGYLFFNISPVEKRVEGDSLDYEMLIYEGKQATINEIIIKGNTKTNEHVVRREIRTKPGELFSREKIIRTVRELATLGHFNPETINPVPITKIEGYIFLKIPARTELNFLSWSTCSGFRSPFSYIPITASIFACEYVPSNSAGVSPFETHAKSKKADPARSIMRVPQKTVREYEYSLLNNSLSIKPTIPD